MGPGLGFPIAWLNGPFFLRHLIALKRRGLLDGYRRVVEIGRQQINDRMIGSPELDEAVALFGGTKPALTPVGAPRIKPNSPPGELLWTALGLQSKSVDIDGGDLHIDLNQARVPWRYRGAFDLAVNAGNDGARRQPGQRLRGDPRSGARRRPDAAPGAGLWARRPRLLRLSAEILSPPGQSQRLRGPPRLRWRRNGSSNCPTICAAKDCRQASPAPGSPSSCAAGIAANS